MSTTNEPTIEEQKARWGQRVAEERDRQGLTQEQLAKRCKLSQATISAIERGTYSGRPRTRLAIAKTLGAPDLFSFDLPDEEAS